MKSRLITALTGSLLASSPFLHAAPELTLRNAFTFSDGAAQGGVEILSYTKDNYSVAGIYVGDTDGSGPNATTYGVQILNLGADYGLTQRHNIGFNTGNTGLSSLLGVSSVALDPLGRGFGVASIIPTANTTTLGKLAFFNYNTGAVIGTIDAGYHPDSVTFSADGSRIYVANEGEINPSAGTQAPGSLSFVNVSGINSGNLASLTSLSASTFDFSAANMGTNASLLGVRHTGLSNVVSNTVPNFNNPTNIREDAIEPEFVTVQGTKAYVTLQENNAIGVFDLVTNKWERINKLGTMTYTTDASDQDGGANINDVVVGMPMPDTIASYTVNGTTYLVTANEGDARPDDLDLSRFGSSGMHVILDDGAYPNSATGIRDNATGQGRLNVSRIDGDTDNDGDIDQATAFGTRSYSIWKVNADNTITLNYDSNQMGEMSLEQRLLSLDPDAFNMNRGDTGARDSRSDDKGPEPEGLRVFEMDGLTLLALGLERQNGILLFDITNPNAPAFLDYVNTYSGGDSDKLVSPEGMYYISAEDSPTGSSLLLVGYEGHDGGASGTIIQGGIGVFTVPEPTAAFLFLGSLGAIALRRRRA